MSHNIIIIIIIFVIHIYVRLEGWMDGRTVVGRAGRLVRTTYRQTDRQTVRTDSPVCTYVCSFGTVPTNLNSYGSANPFFFTDGSCALLTDRQTDRQTVRTDIPVCTYVPMYVRSVPTDLNSYGSANPFFSKMRSSTTYSRIRCTTWD